MTRNWSDYYALHRIAVQHDHRELSWLLIKLESSNQTGSPNPGTGTILGMIAEVAGRHFSWEETLLRENKHPELALHKARHDELLDRLAKLVYDYEVAGFLQIDAIRSLIEDCFRELYSFPDYDFGGVVDHAPVTFICDPVDEVAGRRRWEVLDDE